MTIFTHLPNLTHLSFLHFLSALSSYSILTKASVPLLVRQGKGQEKLGNSLEKLIVRIDRRSDNVLNQSQGENFFTLALYSNCSNIPIFLFIQKLYKNHKC